MKKPYLLLLLAIMCISEYTMAQQLHCGQSEARLRLVKTHPEILQTEADFNAQVRQGIKRMDLGKVARTTMDTAAGDLWYDIPVVVHIVHDYGSEDIPGTAIYNNVARWNESLAGGNAGDTLFTRTYTPNFLPYVGNPHIRLHLATIDPNGHTTKGITRHRSYLTYNGGEQAKYDDWPQSQYLNIWFVFDFANVGGLDSSFAHLPTEVASIPYYDGILTIAYYINGWKMIDHEIGHYLNVYHTWGITGDPTVTCGDDEVDDTPPTKGHDFGGCELLPSSESNSIYDTACAENYYKIYRTAHGTDSLVNYPDTTNVTNIMDLSNCAKMFTKGQVERMHATLNSSLANRNNLWSQTNMINTGVMNSDTTFTPMPDMLPVAEYSVVNSGFPYNHIQYFTCPQAGSHPRGLTFINESWNDTITNANWTFSNGAATPTSTTLASLVNTFTEPGWATITLAATGNNTGTTTLASPSVFVADATGTAADGYYEDFNGPTAAKWPTFNYYNNEFKWQPSTAGVYDSSSMMYVGYDSRIVPATATYPTTGMPAGDFDDMYSIPVDLSGYTGDCSLNYMYSGATRSSNPLDWNDTLEIDYSTDRSDTWTVLTYLGTKDIDNKGALDIPYAPLWLGDWEQMGINIPMAARTNYTIFRFRYRPGIGVGPDSTTTTGAYSSGNNFYMDRVNFSHWPAGVSNVSMANTDVAVAPNPTNGDAYVIIKDMPNTIASVVVTDITGKVVYTTSEQLTGNDARIQIPHAAIAVQGMYIVQAITGKLVSTHKLVVE